jgi:fucose 4-O-acetylase-like acetyltransferase
VKKKIKSLLIPYFAWNTIWILLYMLFEKMPITDAFFENSSKNVSSYSIIDIADAYFGISSDPFLYTLWFIKDLFVLNLLANIIKRLVDLSPRVFLIIIITCSILDLKFIINISSLLYFSAGYYVYKYKNKLKMRINNTLLKKLSIFSWSTLYVLEIIGVTSINVIRLISISLSLYIMWNVSGYINTCVHKRVFLDSSKNVMFIYCGHQYTMLFLKKVLSKFCEQTIFMRLIEYLFLPVMLFCFLSLMAIFTKRRFNKIYLILTGNR